LKILLIVLFLINTFFSKAFSENNRNASILILDKSASTKYELNFSKKIQFRNLSIELITCENIEFDKYVDQIALIKISQEEDIFIGWFFSITDELNLYSNKIYEVTLKSCTNKN
tara:strand:+ start:1118 stop:1459 length:342 start_codon:yes stop_codon:yes gene_type:complete